MAKLPEELIADLRKFMLQALNLTENDGEWVDDFTFRLYQCLNEVSITVKVE